jgi:multidrug efflux system membrane fusion protein
VFVVDKDGKAEYREVKLGPVVDGLRVVKTGLKPGERIVVNGLQRVRPGSPITAQTVPMVATTSDWRCEGQVRAAGHGRCKIRNQ